jgi:hypothetical protein
MSDQLNEQSPEKELFELKTKLSFYELEIRNLTLKLDSQTHLLLQLQNILNDPTQNNNTTTCMSKQKGSSAGKKKMMSRLALDKLDFYHKHKDDKDIQDHFKAIKAIIPKGSSIPWHWIKCLTDNKFIESLSTSIEKNKSNDGKRKSSYAA